MYSIEIHVIILARIPCCRRVHPLNIESAGYRPNAKIRKCRNGGAKKKFENDEAASSSRTRLPSFWSGRRSCMARAVSMRRLGIYEHIQACNPDVLAAPYFLALMDIETGCSSERSKDCGLSRARTPIHSMRCSRWPTPSRRWASGSRPPTPIGAHGRSGAGVPRHVSHSPTRSKSLGQLDEAISLYRALAELPPMRCRADRHCAAEGLGHHAGGERRNGRRGLERRNAGRDPDRRVVRAGRSPGSVASI